jgi:osmotically inducible protein OsmC
LEHGSGAITVGDDVFADDYSCASRFGDGGGTSPEQLLAAAHCGCFTMALAAILSAAGHTVNSLITKARVRLEHVEGQPTLSRIYLTTVGDVHGINQHQFQAYAKRAREECPLSWALLQNPCRGAAR